MRRIQPAMLPNEAPSVPPIMIRVGPQQMSPVAGLVDDAGLNTSSPTAIETMNPIIAPITAPCCVLARPLGTEAIQTPTARATREPIQAYSKPIAKETASANMATIAPTIARSTDPPNN